ncbi:EF-hand protein 5 [Bienertia sinuspersici]
MQFAICNLQFEEIEDLKFAALTVTDLRIAGLKFEELKRLQLQQQCCQCSTVAASTTRRRRNVSGRQTKDTDAVKEALDQLREVGWAKRWSSQPYVSRRSASLRELTSLGIKNAENLAVPSVRNDAAFLFTVVGTTGFLGVLAGQLPGDWGFFVPYLIGSISLVVLGVGSTAPGLLQAAISGFSVVFPDYQERISRHEAAHFLVAYLLGLPILDYSLDIGKEHVNLVNDKLEKLIYSGQLDTKELDRLAVVTMAGLAGEGLNYEKVIGQSADLFTLQNNKAVYEALIAEMSKKGSVLECIKAIEMAS